MSTSLPLASSPHCRPITQVPGTEKTLWEELKMRCDCGPAILSQTEGRAARNWDTGQRIRNVSKHNSLRHENRGGQGELDVRRRVQRPNAAQPGVAPQSLLCFGKAGFHQLIIAGLEG